MAQKILITGASGGFGKLIVHALLKRGHQVAASIRDTKGKNKAVADELANAGAAIVEIDVTNDLSVQEGVKAALEKLKGLDVLINNAGIGVLGIHEFFTPADYQKLFDINVFGVHRMNRAVVPVFRAQKKGLILYTSSLLGRVSMPFYGPYQVSKWGLEAMAESYRVELSGFGIENCVIEPGGYPTTFMENLMLPSDTSRKQSYGPMADMPETMLKGFDAALKNNPQQDPQKVADEISHLIDLPYGKKPFRTTVDFIGMGEPIKQYNAQLENIMTGLYSNMSIQNMLHVSAK